MTELLIENCSNLVSFPEVCFLSSLIKLEIINCNALTSLPKGIVCNSLTGQLSSYLKRLEIESCEKLEYLWYDNEESCTSVVDDENSNNTTRSLLEYLHVEECPSLKCLSSSGLLPETLQYLYVEDCNSLTYIVRGKLPSSLEKLEIKGCEKLEYLWDDKEENCTSVVEDENNNNTSTSHLEYLHVEISLSLKCLSLSGHLPKELRTLSLDYLPEMNLTISIRTNKYKNRHLSMLHFTRKVLPCPVVYFPSCNSFCMHEESKDKEIMNPPLRAFIAVFFLYANTQQLPGFGDRTTIFQSQHFKCQVYVYVLS
ncbi:hypothetical protein LWI29_031374 [Acer saccharum]|uniref:Uncharacterized protein n=1 Tax=Acer saccharum TaxID=4024 RepID=A0AA39T7N8_ACESA|nr:hypothetical protein LWI29_031374 [Acer saccharum]